MDNPKKSEKLKIKRRIKTLKKGLLKAESHLEECQSWEKARHEAELMQANLYRLKKGERFLEVEDWVTGLPMTISLDPQLKPHEEVARRFKKAKKLEKGLPYAISQVNQTRENLEHWQALLLELEILESNEDIEAFKQKYALPQQKPPSKEVKEPKKPYLEYFSKAGVPIWVGKSAAMNDLLTFHYARGNDLWLHVADHPGSHVVIRSQDPDPETLQEALQLALYHSKARHLREGEVVFTQVKYVRRLGGQKGKVQIAEEKRVFVRLHRP